ncbi:adrenocortical dysplasia protein homolog isoform X2 [Cricetulus griseus]|uniref:Adrenocortical dysplasia protein homolog isoform X2 n=1 Tax=Cricetulus griseus TaxID=10029 RepID=G3HZM8_CRIGR|nr:adrenocortical dysplasia protein homolog isoform X2 [Cricetulus griseus]XP_027261645.1 adrenocortical dysplasia protein homolog isoform X2 [Cricetulus griseus]EGV97050.1 Adrenocortical dysplasia protein-like [Cricetulus griseus]ERE77157.1 putative adrenocortical dysplasia protein like protein [Cricetulus griseus]
MLGSGRLELRPWIRELILDSETLSSPRVGQLLKVLQDSETPGPSSAPDTPNTGAVLLVSDGTHSVRCLVTRNAIDTSEWEEKEFGFRGTEGRLLLLQVCGVRIQIAQDRAPAEFYLQVDRFNLLPSELPRLQVTGCNQDSDVQRKLCECLEDYLSESASPSAGLTLSQLLDEVKEDQDHRGALVHLAESCLMLSGPYTATPLTHWTASCFQATEEAMFTVSSLLLHISENDEQILSSVGSSQKTQGNPASLRHTSLEESDASVSLLSDLAASEPGQKDSFQPPPAVCSSSLRPQAPSSPPHTATPISPLLTRTPSRSSPGHASSPYQAHSLEVREFQWPIKKQQLFPRTRAKGAQEPCCVWEPPKRHHDASAFQYKYETPSASLHAQVQTARLPPQLVAWALNLVMESESELTQA